MKKLITLLLLIFLTTTFYNKAYTAPENKAVFQLGSDKFILNSQEQSMDTIPFLDRNRVFVPVRYLAYSCGLDDKGVLWNQSTQTVTLNLNSKSVSVQVGTNQLINNGRAVEMDVTPVIIGDRVFLPARWIAEAYNFKVEWDPKSKAVLIYPPGDLKPLSPEKPAILIVNKTHGLPIDYQPGALEDFNGYQISSLIKEPLQALLAAASAQSIKLDINSGYRDAISQKQIFDERVSQLGYKLASSTAALPGYSEHQTGLAVDLKGDSSAYAWVAANCWHYGFILRYPQDSEEITGYSYEPWHFRYVGKAAASFMRNNNVRTLEELIDTYIGN